ncbi:hypothetical protein TTHERM_000857958 (macronuclear) [Tetrahymena thermophila SB210]|uniref:Uncharacterized protein n=1 Tax=Tetrahymena thermophila (strain SB210) TaxID=312017 RepID=W7X8X3_TETTS|nr:hypothetical protein TTHERM_000857958 [Tetrahymena thermophila SB210]EWS72833.1 hypothetical protein TTHERM_000857958 [Tetrahymena thermophila SB210]|eukprot:XP_012654624.1 hypothetical protein TTHERM_000857958 [Tetrahymena thermophila SB210]
MIFQSINLGRILDKKLQKKLIKKFCKSEEKRGQNQNFKNQHYINTFQKDRGFIIEYLFEEKDRFLQSNLAMNDKKGVQIRLKHDIYELWNFKCFNPLFLFEQQQIVAQQTSQNKIGYIKNLNLLFFLNLLFLGSHFDRRFIPINSLVPVLNQQKINSNIKMKKDVIENYQQINNHQLQLKKIKNIQNDQKNRLLSDSDLIRNKNLYQYQLSNQNLCYFKYELGYLARKQTQYHFISEIISIAFIGFD